MIPNLPTTLRRVQAFCRGKKGTITTYRVERAGVLQLVICHLPRRKQPVLGARQVLCTTQDQQKEQLCKLQQAITQYLQLTHPDQEKDCLRWPRRYGPAIEGGRIVKYIEVDANERPWR